MFGGRINHPAYDSRVELEPNQFLSGITLYTVESVLEENAKPRVRYENIDGVRGLCDDNAEYPVPEWMPAHLKK